MKPSHTRASTGVFFGKIEAGGDDAVFGLIGADNFQKPHDEGRSEEMQSDDIIGPGYGVGDFIDVEVRRIGGDDRAGLQGAIEFGKDGLLDVHVLEYGFDHQINVAEGTVVEAGREPIHMFDLAFFAQPAARHEPFEVL